MIIIIIIIHHHLLLHHIILLCSLQSLSTKPLTGKQNQLRFLVTAMRHLTYCDLTENVLYKLINAMVFASVILCSCKCRNA